DSWHYADYGIPAVSIWQMRIVDDQVVAGTHGRGIWSVTIPELAGHKPPEVTLAPITGKSGQAPNGNLVIETNLRSEYDSTVVRLDNVIKYSLQENEIGMDVISMPYQLQNNLADTVMFEITSYKDGREYKSAKRKTILYRLEEHVITYMNDFEINQNDFVGANFSVDTVANFDNAAIHSRHNYLNQTDLIYMLRTPIVVADTNPQIVYDDVAIIETGQPGSRFGQSTFFDYIVMEATVDGLNWLPVADGYDSDYDPLWLEVYKAKGKGTKDLFVSHTVDLSETFNGKDTILIRFRLHGDPNTNGWGWACDNLNIQEDGAVPVKDYYSYDRGLKINFVSPNPVNNIGILNYSVAQSSNLEIKIYDIGGREIESIRRSHLSAGDYSMKLDMSVYDSGVYFVRISNGNQVVSENIVVQK
ncbi:MAG: T9SS type A sorting domain-containing protein, partial [Chlorobi bacterium]|nr:T9SS type A sorting domain-containing protein [Chlorobiota bacterium]